MTTKTSDWLKIRNLSIPFSSELLDEMKQIVKKKCMLTLANTAKHMAH